MRIQRGSSISNMEDGEVSSSRIIRYASGYAPYVEDRPTIDRSMVSMGVPKLGTLTIHDMRITKGHASEVLGTGSSARRRKAGVSVITKGPLIHWGTCRS